ncbi:MAG: helix-turn-helix domain-containing protein [Gemmatimonadaceae bacterium]|nr:helix-turn-helix domain-containing protein [Gemmatimonadaceae bacterium]
MRPALTAMEAEVYRTLLDFLAEHTFQPSVREIADALSIASTKSVVDLLASLEEKGYLEREAGRSRGVKLLGWAGLAGTVPVPEFAVTPDGSISTVAHFSIDRALLPSLDAGFVRVHDGAPLARAGDLALVLPSTRIGDDDPAVVLLGGRVTIGRLQRAGLSLVLRSLDDGASRTLGAGDRVLGPLAWVLARPQAPGGFPAP